MPLTPEERERYSRQMILPEFGELGQERMKAARILIVGAGGLGSPAALYLTAMGVGTLGLVDDDRVAVSNLHRQILYGDADAGKLKAPLAMERLSEMNSGIVLQAFDERLTRENVLDVLRDFDLVLDGSDNFATRYLVNDACLVLGIPLVSASIFKFEGQLTALCTDGGPCYRCLFPEYPDPASVPSCAEAGVIGALAGVMGTMMAMEAVKLIAAMGQPLVHRLFIYDALAGTVKTMHIERDPKCPMCSIPVSERKLSDSYEDQSCSSNALEITWQDYARTPMPLIDVREEWEFYGRPSKGKLIPMGSLMARIRELPREPFGIVCASGSRSLTAAAMLRSRGFSAVSIRGGVNAQN